MKSLMTAGQRNWVSRTALRASHAPPQMLEPGILPSAARASHRRRQSGDRAPGAPRQSAPPTRSQHPRATEEYGHGCASQVHGGLLFRRGRAGQMSFLGTNLQSNRDDLCQLVYHLRF